MGVYDKLRKRLAPPWLRDAVSDGWHVGHGTIDDQVAQSAKDAVKAKFPDYAPTDALPAIAADRMLERGPAELEAAFRARLLAAPDAWKWAGTRTGILEYALKPAGITGSNAAGYTATKLLSAKDFVTLGGLPPRSAYGPATGACRFWVVIAKPHEFTFRLWGSVGGTWGSTGTTWGSSATTEAYQRIRRTILKWKSARDLCMGVWIVNGTSTTIDTVPGTAWSPASATFGGAAAVFWPFHTNDQ